MLFQRQWLFKKEFTHHRKKLCLIGSGILAYQFIFLQIAPFLKRFSETIIRAEHHLCPLFVATVPNRRYTVCHTILIIEFMCQLVHNHVMVMRMIRLFFRFMPCNHHCTACRLSLQHKRLFGVNTAVGTHPLGNDIIGIDNDRIEVFITLFFSQLHQAGVKSNYRFHLICQRNIDGAKLFRLNKEEHRTLNLSFHCIGKPLIVGNMFQVAAIFFRERSPGNLLPKPSLFDIPDSLPSKEKEKKHQNNFD